MSVDWNELYQQGDTPWEKGKPHPELPFLLQKHDELVKRAEVILVPGCGLGHDARLISRSSEARVIGLDLAPEAIARARDLSPAGDGDGTHRLAWEVGDLFTREDKADLVFEHTCFCAIPVERRPDYLRAVSRILPSGGHLLGIFFLNPDHEGEEGPPFGVEREELEEFFREDFDLLWAQEPRQTFPAREGEGRELCLLMQRK